MGDSPVWFAHNKNSLSLKNECASEANVTLKYFGCPFGWGEVESAFHSTEDTYLPLMSSASDNPAVALSAGKFPLVLKYSAIAVFAPEARTNPSAQICSVNAVQL